MIYLGLNNGVVLSVGELLIISVKPLSFGLGASNG